MSKNGMAASSQPLAVETAINVLRTGGNAVDAAVAATAVLAVTEPMSTGLGGDCFALMYIAAERKLVAINGSGRSPLAASAEKLLASGLSEMPLRGPLSVTVPGALDGLFQCLSRYGTISLQDAFTPAISCASEGFPVGEVTAQVWRQRAAVLSIDPESTSVYLPNGRPPLAGETFRNADLARTLKLIADNGPDIFYRGELGEALVNAVQNRGGHIDHRDLSDHRSDWVEPISTSYRGIEVVEMPPNTQGIAALLALNIVENHELSRLQHNSAEYLCLLIEAMRIALVETQKHIGDPDLSTDIARLLSKQYATQRATEVNSIDRLPAPSPHTGDTVYVAVVDHHRNVVSMISSLFKAFGSGITVPATGLLLQNRGAGFILQAGHPNRLEGGKRPFHTILPAMILRESEPWACLGVVGGLMQAQGHLQVVCNLVDFAMNPQAALDAPRFRVLPDGATSLEEGIPRTIATELSAKGISLNEDATEEGFGGGQVILIEDSLYGGSDSRKDGCALGY
ncbi:MAG TPA: gamma-glutamyltransferase [Blastocatellia bacterium]|nr:gamma-glutamyltransferase [Blastocatellia bacterium]